MRKESKKNNFNFYGGEIPKIVVCTQSSTKLNGHLKLNIKHETKTISVVSQLQ